ncbi:TldD/PmbA family protein [Psychrobacillus sp. NEAU-3TGS]|uniref:TldD/PmbA family protein n=1 Tax=Psychrobacillus sp. NEAU-3TGS TaxID=2995412 RepID=UPI002497E690|nr:TldD/PmbA family protein [Psychrobacillus sp. NEAU-3TGS]MDI2589338.1 TldD/PmbA family protein [Psychrobacillus sp. NEAU-3TGS]
MIKQSIIENVLEAALSNGGDFSEVFIEDKYVNRLELQSGKIEKSISGRDFGIGIRIFSGLQSIYTYTTDFSEEGLLRAAKRAAHAIKNGTNGTIHPLRKEMVLPIHQIGQMPKNVEHARKVAVMRKANEIARNYDERIRQVGLRYIDEEQHVLIANSEGKFVEDTRVHSRLSIQATASDGLEMQTGFYGPGAHAGFEFIENLNLEHYAGEAARIAITMLGADECPSGKFPVIIDNEFGGVIFHEACGHGLEATSVAKNNSVFANRIGEKVAPDIVTYIDDGTLPNEWGSLNIDDEGEKTRKNVLIENGILKGYLIDKFNARRMNAEATGSSRRESYRFNPTSRMTNTYIAPGTSTPEEIIASTENGLYAKYMGGGSVNPATGDYNFAVSEAYLVKNGKIDRPVRGATLIGNGAKTLQLVDKVGNNLAHGAGMCGSISGSLPVNVGQPMIRISEITVGGTKGE